MTLCKRTVSDVRSLRQLFWVEKRNTIHRQVIDSICNFKALSRTYFLLTKGHVMCFGPKTIIASFLHPLILISKAFINWLCNLLCIINSYLYYNFSYMYNQLCLKQYLRNYSRGQFSECLG